MWMDYDERAMAEAEMRAEQEHFDSIEPDLLPPDEDEVRRWIEEDDAYEAELARLDALDAAWEAEHYGGCEDYEPNPYDGTYSEM